VRYLFKTTSLLLLCVAQLFVPTVNLAFELPCDEEPTKACEAAPCCQAETSARMSCCEVQPSPVSSEQTPAAPASPLRIYFDLAAPVSFAEAGDEMGWIAKPDHAFSSFNTHFAGNQLYKLLAVFLI
jgi:hypothetical protein